MITYQSKLASLLLLLLLSCGVLPAMAQPEEVNWSRFRGADGSGIAPSADLPLTFDMESGENILWKTPLPLPGSNSPVLWDDLLFVAGADKSRSEVYCLDANDGSLLWTTPVDDGAGDLPVRFHSMTGYAASTAATDGERVYAIFPTGNLVALDMAGEKIWQRNYDLTEDFYGHASSLVIWEKLLIVQLDLGKPDIGLSRMVALNCETGEIVWDISRPVQGSWTTPIIIDTGQRLELITSAKPWVISYNPRTGEEYWRVFCIEGDSAPSPIFAAGHIFIANIYAKLVKIEPGGEGDVTDTHLKWSVEGSLPDICSPVSNGELVFTLSSNGILSCYETSDGTMVWCEELHRNFRTSPSLIGDRLYLFSDKGEMIVIAAAREYTPLTTSQLNEPIYSCPAFKNNKMFIRSEQTLFCLGYLELSP